MQYVVNPAPQLQIPDYAQCKISYIRSLCQKKKKKKERKKRKERGKEKKGREQLTLLSLPAMYGRAAYTPVQTDCWM